MLFSHTSSFLPLYLRQTSETSFITNKLFGRGRRWNGKAFADDGRTGINRFVAPGSDRHEREHRFDISLERSRLVPAAATEHHQPLSIVLRYGPYQRNPLSPWKTMRDEIRVVSATAGSDDGQHQQQILLLGMGCMAWSGGMLNCSPFCLYRDRWKSESEQ
jgi:hypothetical protein